jgi:PAS domain S-box-containing protein
MHENLEKIKGFFKDEQSFFAAKQLLFESDGKLPNILLYRIIDSIRDAVFVIDKDWKYEYLNQKAEEVTWSKKGEMIGREVWSIYPHIKSTKLGIAMLTAVKDKSPIKLEQFQYEDGRWFDMMLIPFKDHLIALASEITIQKRVEFGYDNVVVKNRAILTAIPDALYRIHTSGLVINYKDYPEFSDWEKDQNIQFLKLEDVFPENQLECIDKMKGDVLEEDSVATMEYSVDEYDGEKFYEMRLTKSGENEVLAIIRNITIRKKAERLKNEFISLVSHELRTPLTSIKGAIELLIGGVAGEINNQAKSLLNICRKNTLRLVRFVSDLLDIESLDSGNINFSYQNHSLGDLVYGTVEGMRTFAEQFHVVLQFEKPSTSIEVYVDEDRFSHCIGNLISNAVKYTPKYSSVIIAVGENENHAFLTVKDFGPGINSDFQPRLFHRFAQGPPPKDKLVGGSGLGLSITKAFVEAMLGKISYETSSQGTTFIIEFPIIKESTSRLASQ